MVLFWFITVPVCLLLGEILIRVFLFFLLPFFGGRLRSTVEHHVSTLSSTFSAFNISGLAVLETELGAPERWRSAAKRLERNVPMLSRDCSGWYKLPFIVLPGRPGASVKVTIRETEFETEEKLEHLAKQVMVDILNTPWPKNSSPFSITVLGGKGRLAAVVFAADHCFLDGSSVIELARRYLMLLSGQDPGAPIPSNIPASLDEFYPWACLWAFPFLFKAFLGLVEFVRETRWFAIKSLPFPRMGGSDDALDLKSSSPLGTDYTLISSLVLSNIETEQLFARIRLEKVTFGNVLMVATCKTMWSVTPTPSDPKDYYLVNMVDHRRLQPQKGPYRLGMLVSTLTFNDPCAILNDMSLTKGAARVKKVVSEAFPSFFYLIPAMYTWMFLFATFTNQLSRMGATKTSAAGHDNLWPMATCSNLGQLATPRDFKSRHNMSSASLIPDSDYAKIPRILRFMGSASSGTSFPYVIVSAMTTEGRLCVTLTGNRFIWSQGQLDAFACKLEEALTK